MMLVLTKRTEPRLLDCMKNHYSQPKGFVGRNLCYGVLDGDVYYGHIVGGSATLHLPGRNGYFGIGKSHLSSIVNNIFFHIEKFGDKYPQRNFAQSVLKAWRNRVSSDWHEKYGDVVLGFESLVELPRTGEVYRRDGWVELGQTKGFTCKRTAGKGTDSWGGKRVWNITELRPKRVFCKRNLKYDERNIDTGAHLGTAAFGLPAVA
jgi:hypothetical protein